jgi:hypothetical protein
MSYVTAEQQFRFTDAAGNVIWEGSFRLGTLYECENQSTSAAIARGVGVVVDGPNSTFARPDNTASGTPLKDLLRINGCTSGAVSFLGVLSETVPARDTAKAQGDYTGIVLGPACVTVARATSAAIAVGALIVASATAAQVMAAATKDATTPAYGTVLGMCLKANAVLGSGSTYYVGLMVQPT